MLNRVTGFINRWIYIQKEKKSLGSVPIHPVWPENLCHTTMEELRSILHSGRLEEAWRKDGCGSFQECRIEDGRTEGVNVGDRRAIWYLVRSLAPFSVLEIGTHVGASTAYIASAIKGLHRTTTLNKPQLTTVDIHDVNDERSGYWKKMGLDSSPRQMLAGMSCDHFVHFVTADSVSFMSNCSDRFDFIFLDGDHSAASVYREIPLALKLLNQNGWILLHDYFPRNMPLWRDGRVTPGPFLALSRLKKEGAPLRSLPLGELPWCTKLDSNRTSLCLLSRVG